MSRCPNGTKGCGLVLVCMIIGGNNCHYPMQNSYSDLSVFRDGRSMTRDCGCIPSFFGILLQGNSDIGFIGLVGSSSCNLELWLHHYDVMVVAIGA